MLARMKRRRGEEGASLVELALVVGIFAPVLIVGTAETSVLVYASIELSDATHAAAAYAAQYYIQSSDTALPTNAQVSTAASNDSPELTNLLVHGTSLTATIATGCGSGAATTGNTVPSCSSGTLPYVQVTTSATVNTIFNYLPPNSFTMTSKAVISLVN